jgi:hypothetical protein
VKSWIAVQLVDEDNKPVPKAKFKIRFPDGVEEEHELDDNGYKYFPDLDPGECEIGFPDLEPFCELVTSVMASKTTDPTLSGKVSGASGSPAPLTSISIALHDEQDKGVPKELYHIKTPDGDIAKGFLEDSGKTTIHGIAAGNCEVSFPNIDPSYVTFVKST